MGILPDKKHRQSLLFSATFPPDIQQLCSYSLRPGYTRVDCVGEAEAATVDLVTQHYMVGPVEEQAASLLRVIDAHRRAEPQAHKVIAFFATARQTQYYSELFAALGLPVLEMHSRKSQTYRTRVADEFRASRGGCVMFTSDVSARGVDYPDVTLVVQVGLPQDRAQYVHRVGRTARAGRSGLGVLLLTDYEADAFLPELLQPARGGGGGGSGNGAAASGPVPITSLELPASVSDPVAARQAVSAAAQRISSDTRGQAYQAWLGFYNSNLRRLRWTPEKLVAAANHYAVACMGCSQPPALQKKTIGKMGLKGVPGLRIATGDEAGGGGRGGGGRGGGGGGGGHGGGGGGGRGGPGGYASQPMGGVERFGGGQQQQPRGGGGGGGGGGGSGAAAAGGGEGAKRRRRRGGGGGGGGSGGGGGGANGASGNGQPAAHAGQKRPHPPAGRAGGGGGGGGGGR
jgi:ATP-dependent RNA helicase MSS116